MTAEEGPVARGYDGTGSHDWPAASAVAGQDKPDWKDTGNHLLTERLKKNIADNTQSPAPIRELHRSLTWRRLSSRSCRDKKQRVMKGQLVTETRAA